MDAMTQPKISIGGGTFFVADWPADAGRLAGARLQITLSGGPRRKRTKWVLRFRKPGTTTEWLTEQSITLEGGIGVEEMLSVLPTRFFEGGTAGKRPRQLAHDTRLWKIPVINAMVHDVADSVRAWMADPISATAAEYESAKRLVEAHEHTVAVAEAELARQRRRLEAAMAELDEAMARYRAVGAGG